jgi:hypothetical protein
MSIKEMKAMINLNESDRNALEAQLDVHPQDFESRLILSDILEEHQDMKMARCQRWLATNKLYPDNNLKGVNNQGWHWWSNVEEKHKERFHALLPDELHPHMSEGEWLFETRQEAESVLADALEKLENGKSSTGV